MSFVRVIPTIFCSRADPPDPGICPSRCSGSAYWHVSEPIQVPEPLGSAAHSGLSVLLAGGRRVYAFALALVTRPGLTRSWARAARFNPWLTEGSHYGRSV